MSETFSEKRLKDTLCRMKHEDKIIHYQKNSSSQYQKELIDFTVLSNNGKTHWIEVKQTGSSTSFPRSRFNEEQYEFLKDPLFNRSDSHTRAWVLGCFFDGDHTRAHGDYYELYFLFPGEWVTRVMSLSNARKANRTGHDIWCVGAYVDGDYHNMKPDWGLTTRGNQDLGFRTLYIEEDI